MFSSTYTLVESEYTQFRQRAKYMFCPPVHHADKISDEHGKTKAAPFVRKERLLFVADVPTSERAAGNVEVQD